MINLFECTAPGWELRLCYSKIEIIKAGDTQSCSLVLSILASCFVVGVYGLRLALRSTTALHSKATYNPIMLVRVSRARNNRHFLTFSAIKVSDSASIWEHGFAMFPSSFRLMEDQHMENLCFLELCLLFQTRHLRYLSLFFLEIPNLGN
jgi:hypothetical protein